MDKASIKFLSINNKLKNKYMKTKYLLKNKGKELYFNSLEETDNFLSLKEIAERREANKNKTKTI